MGSAELSFGVLSAELWSLQGLALARTAYRGLGRRGLLAFARRHARQRARLARGHVRLGARARTARAVGAAHRARARAGGRPGFMTQVIGAPSSSAACRCRRAAASGSSRRSRRSCARAAASCAPAPTSSACSSRRPRDRRRGSSAASGHGDSRGDRQRHADAALRPAARPGATRRRGLASAAAGASATAAPGMQIHLALCEPPEWASREAERLARTAIVHVTPGPRRRLARRQRGRARPAAGRGDDRRRPALRGRPEPRARGQLDRLDPAAGAAAPAARRRRSARSTSATARWTEELREAYADRITARLGTPDRNLKRATIRRVVLSPADLEALNCNLVGGDIYAGSCALDQNLLWRPTGRLPGPRDAGRRALADRRLDAPRARARRRARATSSRSS